MAGEPFVKGVPHITEKIYGLIKVRAIHDVSMLAHATVIHAFRRWRSRRTIDLSVKNNSNPRILEWPMPGSDIITPSGCFLGIEKSFFLLLNLGLKKVITYQKHTLIEEVARSAGEVMPYAGKMESLMSIASNWPCGFPVMGPFLMRPSPSVKDRAG